MVCKCLSLLRIDIVVGVDINLTAGGFQGVGVSASGGKGKVKGNGTTHIENTIEAKDTLTIQSEADTNIIGSQVKRDIVKAEIGGDLNIQTLQDTDNYHEKQTNWNISVSGIGTGGTPGVSGGYSQMI